MRKIVLFLMSSLDGYFEGPNNEIDWHNVDDEFNLFAEQQLNTVDVILFGRKTYQLMANYWPSPEAIKNDPIIAQKMNSARKIVFSKTLKSADWNNTTLIKDHVKEEILKIKSKPGKDVIIFGSSNFSEFLANEGLIDEYRIMINPVLLGKGNSLLKSINQKLKLIGTKIFQSGNVLLYYQLR